MVIGLISDTHNLLDPRVPKRFEGVDHILHAGDVCIPRLVSELERVAPVTVVLGNNDPHVGWRETELVELGEHRILVQHIVRPDHPDPAFRQRLRRSGAGIVIFGHTHRPCRTSWEGSVLINPGSAGSPRFGLPPSVARLHLEGPNLRVEFLDLDGQPLAF